MKTEIEIRMGDTSYGTVRRVISKCRTWRAVINGERTILTDCFSVLPKAQVMRLPRDLDMKGYS